MSTSLIISEICRYLSEHNCLYAHNKYVNDVLALGHNNKCVVFYIKNEYFVIYQDGKEELYCLDNPQTDLITIITRKLDIV